MFVPFYIGRVVCLRDMDFREIVNDYEELKITNSTEKLVAIWELCQSVVIYTGCPGRIEDRTENYDRNDAHVRL